jgi:hypothetical protein
MTPAWLLSAILALPISRHDRAPELAAEKRQQLELVATAIHEAAEATRWPGGNKSELRALLIVTGYHESAFALHVTRGELKPWEGDPGKDGLPRSVSNWQLQKSATSSGDAWEAARTDVRVAAREAARALARGRWMCRSLEQRGQDWRRMVFAAYAGRGCSGWFRGLDERVEMLGRLAGR